MIWLAIILIGAFTYFTRALPFISKSKWLDRAAGAPWLDRLGPVLLVSMLVAIILPYAGEQIVLGLYKPLVIGILVVLLALKIKPNAGLATLADILCGCVFLGI